MSMFLRESTVDYTRIIVPNWSLSFAAVFIVGLKTRMLCTTLTVTHAASLIFKLKSPSNTVNNAIVTQSV